MKPGTIGVWAQGTAGSRAIESARPRDERLFEDPLGRGFVDKALWRGLIELCRFQGVRSAVLAVRDWQYPGMVGNQVCRTRVIDDALHDALQAGLDQVVILAAGLDTRAYRSPGIDSTRVFEVDRAGTLAWKMARLKQMLGSLPAHVVFVPFDLERQTLDAALGAAGFRTGARTFFIWEGATQTIAEKAVDATFRYVARVAAAGSRIAFTYVHRGLIQGANGFDGFRKVLRRAERAGEPWLSGFDPAEIEAYLAARGLAVLDHIGAPEYQTRYLQPLGREMKVFAGERVVLAQVAGSWHELNRRH